MVRLPSFLFSLRLWAPAMDFTEMATSPATSLTYSRPSLAQRLPLPCWGTDGGCMKEMLVQGTTGSEGETQQWPDTSSV